MMFWLMREYLHQFLPGESDSSIDIGNRGGSTLPANGSLEEITIIYESHFGGDQQTYYSERNLKLPLDAKLGADLSLAYAENKDFFPTSII